MRAIETKLLDKDFQQDLPKIYSTYPEHTAKVYPEFTQNSIIFIILPSKTYSEFTQNFGIFLCWYSVFFTWTDTHLNKQEQYSLHVGHVPGQELSFAVEKYPNCPTEVLQWLHSSHHAASH